MRKPSHGPSLYYATDKNIFDALNQHKVDSKTIASLFERRNIVICSKSDREEVATYFSRLNHDFYDHKDIAARLGVAPRRERITSMDLSGEVKLDDMKSSVDKLKKELEASGDVVQISKDNDSLTINIQYSTIDYGRSEFSQVQNRDGKIEFIRTTDGFVVRSNHNDYINNVRDSLIGKIEKDNDKEIEKSTVSLFDIPSPKLRSKFFHKLMSDIKGYQWQDVTDVYVYKPKPEVDEEDDDNSEDQSMHVERVLLRGHGVTRSDIFNELLDEEDYYIIKINWTTKETMGAGNVYDIEALFSNPKDCSEFTFILSGVYPYEDGKILRQRRAPTRDEISIISSVIEVKTRQLVLELRDEYNAPVSGS